MRTGYGAGFDALPDADRRQDVDQTQMRQPPRMIEGEPVADSRAAIMADELAIGVINNKTTATRLVPVPGAKAGDLVDFGGLFGHSPVLEVRNVGVSEEFVQFGGRIPAPLQSLGN